MKNWVLLKAPSTSTEFETLVTLLHFRLMVLHPFYFSFAAWKEVANASLVKRLPSTRCRCYPVANVLHPWSNHKIQIPDPDRSIPTSLYPNQ